MNKGKTNLVLSLLLMTFMGLGCNMLKSSETTETPKNSTPQETNTSTSNTSKETEDKKSPTVEKADFTMTSEELDKEFTRKGVKDTDLEKYAKKNIAVTGRVSTLVMEKKETTQPWVTLYAPGVMHGVSCYFDDENVEQMKKLTMDKMATVQGFQDDFIVPEVSPMLKHCIVLDSK